MCRKDFLKGKTGGRLPKWYPYCMDSSSYSFQGRKLLFCRSILDVSERCKLLWFWFLIIYANYTSCWTWSFFVKYCIKSIPFFWLVVLFNLGLTNGLWILFILKKIRFAVTLVAFLLLFILLVVKGQIIH